LKERIFRPFRVFGVFRGKICQELRTLQIERLLTYILNYPPSKGGQQVRVFYRGDLATLGTHVASALRNTFQTVEPVPADKVRSVSGLWHPFMFM
jgi:hypothetical protein